MGSDRRHKLAKKWKNDPLLESRIWLFLNNIIISCTTGITIKYELLSLRTEKVIISANKLAIFSCIFNHIYFSCIIEASLSTILKFIQISKLPSKQDSAEWSWFIADFHFSLGYYERISIILDRNNYLC